MCMTRRQARGFTLIELIFFIVVVGVALTGILSVSTTIVKSSADPLVRKQALAIGQALLEEILQKEYAKPAGSTVLGFAGGGTRNLFDCVIDYQGYATTSGIVDSTGAPVIGLEAYNTTVTVTSSTLGAVPAYLVMVSVRGPLGQVALSGYRGNY